MKRILIVDDHSIVRRGMRQILEETGDSFEFGEAENASEAITQIRDSKWDLVLLDVAMPGKRGPELLVQIKLETPKLPVLVLSAYPEEQYAVRLIKAGAAGYLNKKSAPDFLVEAVKTALKGSKFISPQVAVLLADSISDNEEGSKKLAHEKLSDREYVVFTQIALGVPLSDIGKELNLSVKTIATYRTRLMEKMALKSNAEITLYAMRNNLID